MTSESHNYQYYAVSYRESDLMLDVINDGLLI